MPGRPSPSTPACRHLVSDRGALSTFVAAAMVLPLLLLTVYGGLSALSIAQMSQEVAAVRSGALLQVEDQGGVTAAIKANVRSSLARQPAFTAIQVTGSAPPVPWGRSVHLSVFATVSLSGPPWTFMGLGGHNLRLGGTSYGTSNLPPS